MTLSRGQIGLIKGIAIALFMALLTYLSDAANLNGVVSISTGLIISGLASSLESYMQSKGSGGLFGTVNVEEQ